MSAHRLRFRQVHLDFHTSGEITEIGSKFDRKRFQDCLQEARVDSITCFSKCHHGWSYHETEVGRKHPHLKFDLLAEQIDACREIGVRVPIYLSAGFDEVAAAEHPEWIVKRPDGTTHDPFQAVYRRLRWNSPYLDYLCRQIEEVVDRWPDADGIFLDIVRPWPDYSEESLRAMMRAGFDPRNEEEALRWANDVLLEYFMKTTSAAKKNRADMPIFHNSSHVSVGGHRFLDFNSHLELESLPTGGWGYDHFPLSARYAATTRFDYLGMTGKFHTSWGEFGGYKRPAALRYECAAMLAYGAKCSVGDQLHPSGEMNADTYALIGEAYRSVEAAEPWCDGVTPVASIGLLSAEEHQGVLGHRDRSADEGASRMLLEAQLPFVVLDRFAAWDGLDLVILPDSVQLEGELLERAQSYLKAGGRMLASGHSLLNPERTAFVLDAGVKLKGRSEFDPDYLVATAFSKEVPVRAPIVIPGGAWDAEPRDAEIFVARANPWFNRAWDHFCSHRHAPDAGPSQYPGATIFGNVAWFAHSIFTCYRRNGQPLYRDFVVAAIRRLLGGRMPVETTLPSTGRVNLMNQASENRYVFHLLHAAPSLRGGTGPGDSQPVEVIEEILPVFDVACRVRLPKEARAVRLAPGGEPLDFTLEEGATCFRVPRVEGHQMVEIVRA